MTNIGYNLKKKSSRPELRKKLSPHEGGRAAVLAAQGGCAVSILGGFQSQLDKALRNLV